MAVRVLTTWGEAHWPQGARDMLQRAIDEEPNAASKELIAEALAPSTAADN